MREIKFRAWSQNENGYKKGAMIPCEISLNGKAIIWRECKDYGTVTVERDNKKIQYYADWDTPQEVDYPVMQFTGLKDNIGQEIYEHDIVRFTYWWFDGYERDTQLTGTIVYSDDLMSFQLKGVKNKEWEHFTGHENDCEYLTAFSELNFCEADFKVLGNIHENPELLEVGE